MKVLDRVGRVTIEFFEYAGGIVILAADSGGFFARLKIRFIETINQCYFWASNHSRSCF